MTVTLFIIFALPLLLSLFLTPMAKRLAHRWGALDISSDRKIHSGSIPRLGGIAVFLSFMLTLGFIYFQFPELFLAIIKGSEQSIINIQPSIPVIIAVLMILIIGVWDDISTLGPGLKFAVQLIAATLIYLSGYNISSVTNPVGPGVLDLQLFSYPLTVLWIVGITNAFNLIDGLDGLASGVASIALITIFTISLVHQQVGTAIAALILTGAILGFLWFNFRPATIFLGDSGSLFIGFVLSLLSIQSFTKVSTTFATLVPVFALGLPILDTSLSIVRRFFSWFLPDRRGAYKNITFKEIVKSIFLPDKSHIHHQLINNGLSHKHTVLLLYLVSFLFCMGAFLVSVTDHLDTTILVVLFILFTIKMGINRLRYKEIKLFHNGILLTLYNYFIINKRYFRNTLDAVFVVISYAGSYYLLYPSEFTILVTANPREAAVVATIIACVQIGIFWASGLYKKIILHLGIAGVVKTLKSIGLAVIAAACIHHFFFGHLMQSSLLLFVINFYFLTTLVLGMRVSFYILKHLFHKSRENQQRILIYGAGEQGVLALQQIMSMASPEYTIVGFIDDDPGLEGKMVNGYPVFGGYWKLERLVRTENIDKLLIANHKLHPKVARRLETIAGRHNLDIQLVSMQFKDLKLYSAENESLNSRIKYVN